MVASRFTGWTPRPVLGLRSAYYSEFLVGRFDGWNVCPSSSAQSGGDHLLLWQLDSGRKLLCVSSKQRGPNRHLGHPRKGTISKIGAQPNAADNRTSQLLGSATEQGRQKDLRGWRAAPRRTPALRHEAQPVCALYEWPLGRTSKIFAGRSVGCLCNLPGRYFVKKQT